MLETIARVRLTSGRRRKAVLYRGEGTGPATQVDDRRPDDDGQVSPYEDRPSEDEEGPCDREEDEGEVRGKGQICHEPAERRPRVGGAGWYGLGDHDAALRDGRTGWGPRVPNDIEFSGERSESAATRG